MAVYIAEQRIRVPKFLVTTVFQVNLYDMVISYTSFFQMMTEEIEKQIRLAAAPYTSHHFYHPIVLAVNEFLQMNISLYHHRCLLFLRKYAFFVNSLLTNLCKY